MAAMNRASSEMVSTNELAKIAGAWPNPAGEASVSLWRSKLGFALLIVLGWTAVSLFQAFPDMIDGFRWNELVTKMIDAWAWALLTPAILLIDRKLTQTHSNTLRLTGIHLILSIPFSIVHTYLSGLLLYPIPEIWWNPIRLTEFAIYFYIGGWVTYCAFIGALQAFKFHNHLLTSQVELERVEKWLVEARLNALRLQLEPHFLFNTLNAISSELAANPALAREMIENLGALLRRSLDCQGSTEITLAQELALLDHYLAIQKLRFGDRITIQTRVEPATLSAMVPSMFLQPLVENAIRHGIEGRMSGGKVLVSARHVDEQLHIKVRDDGVGLPRHWRMEACAGLGVRVTHERLQALYAERGGHDFSISRRRRGGTEVAIRIPLHRPGA